MAVLDKHPSLSQQDAARRLEIGMAAGYKEYGVAPWVVLTQVSLPAELWSGAFFSWFSLKAHVQSYHDLVAVQMFASRNDDSVLAMFVLEFATQDSLRQFMETGYTVSTMLVNLGVPEEDIHVQLLREFS